MMFLSRFLTGRTRQATAARSLLACLNKQSRSPVFFATGIIPDTMDGRFECVTLHSALLLRRLRESGREGRALANTLFEEIFDSFDHALRESGVGDLTVGKKIRVLGESFYGRARAYDAAVSDKDDIASVIERNLLPGSNRVVIEQISQYTVAQAGHLEKQSDNKLLIGNVNWLDPAQYIR